MCMGQITLRRTSVFLDDSNLRALAAIGKKKGELKMAQLIRVAIQEYIDRQK